MLPSQCWVKAENKESGTAPRTGKSSGPSLYNNQCRFKTKNRRGKKKKNDKEPSVHVHTGSTGFPPRQGLGSELSFLGWGEPKVAESPAFVAVYPTKKICDLSSKILPQALFFRCLFFYRGAMVALAAFGAGRKLQAAPDKGLESLQGLLQ